MRHGRILAFAMLALLAGGILAQLPLAAAEDSDSLFGALWDAIFDLQSRDEQLQAQIDQLRAEREALLARADTEPMLVSDLYATIEVEALEQDRTLVHITVGNNGPDRAAGTKLTAFYLLPLFEINSIDGDLCMDKSRGIIECIIGTLEQGEEVTITVDATARESGKTTTWTVDVSTTTDEADYSDNHVTYDFETGSGETIEIPEIEKPETTKPVQDYVVPNSAETEAPPENMGNQTSAEPEETSSGNQTSAETKDSTNSTNTDTGQTENSGSQVVGDSSSDSAGEDAPEQEEESVPENAGNDDAQEEQPGESAPNQPIEEQDQEEQGVSGESDSEPVGESSGENSESNQEQSSATSEESSDSGQAASGENSGPGEGGESGVAGETQSP